MNCDPSNPKGCGFVNVWQETFPVRFGTIDKSDRLTLNSIFNYFQEAAICHAENLNVGREEMIRTGQAWILSRMSVLVERRPKYSETVTVRTWPRGWEKLFAIRNFQITDADNVPVVSARSAWLIVDMEKRRPLRPQALMDQLPLNEGLDTLTDGTMALEERKDLQKISERKALYTDIDFNGHVNNVHYIQWIEDSLDKQLLENANKMRIDINYLSEIMYGEEAELLSSPIEDTNGTAFAFEGKKKENAQAAFRSELRMRV